MQRPSAELCRAQQALHVSRAAAATLENVRLLAERAAKAWGAEALAADDREARLVKRIRERERDQMLDRLATENPDRGQSDTSV
jgi:hypothetical protein